MKQSCLSLLLLQLLLLTTTQFRVIQAQRKYSLVLLH